MFTPNTGRVFALPAGCDFPAALVAGLQARMNSQPPEAMARVTLYVNTNRMQARIGQIFTASGARFLPKLRLVTQLAQDPRLDLPPPVSALRRQLHLATLIDGLLQAQPDLAPRAAVFDLAQSLARLLDEMQGEDVSPRALANLDVSGHSAHWARAQAFLSIVTPLFDDASGPEARRRAAVSMLADHWAAHPPQDPILIAGTTGSRKATAEFMQIVCALPQGGIILPGYDFDQPASVWQYMDDALASEDHPQYRFRRLMDRLGIGPEDVARWHDTPPPSPERNALISLALRPAPVTDQWLQDGPRLTDLRSATAEMTLIEAPSPRSEALAIAAVLAQAASQQGVKAALITPDRNLSRQVTAALDRFGIVPDDSAGRPLALSAAGRLLRHTAALRVEPLAIDRLLILLKHPLAASGAGRGAHLMATRELELHLRRKGPAFPSHGDVLAWAAKRGDEAARWAEALRPLFAAKASPAPQPLADHISQHLALSEALARGTDQGGAGALWQAEAGRAAQELLCELQAAADAASPMTATEYRHLFDSLIGSQQLREPQIAHPNILIWGTIEARVQGCDLVILGGLNDADWPKLPEPDPWLNRKMRKDAGLLLPDRQIGLAAHDFQQAICAPRVVLTRALRNADAETIPSRWLNRLTNLMAGLPEKNGPEALKDMRRRGADILALTRAMDRPSAELLALPSLRPSPRPAPNPPLTARPRELPVTAMEQLIINPYHVYARYILGLRPLPPMRAAAGARDQGTAVHQILEAFVKTRPEDETRAAAQARLRALATDIFAQNIAFPATRALWLAKLMHVADFFLRVDAAWGGTALIIEEKGRYALEGLGFTLTATPDRIDRLPDGRLHLIDYKTGAPPSVKDQAKHRKQLLFTAVLAQNGGFSTLGPSDVGQISYLSLSRSEKAVETALTPDQIEAEAEILRALIAAYNAPSAGYTARRADFSAYAGDYDHLMRYGEWDTSDPAVPIIVGGRHA
ncbi:MAG: double-strand break repair protein AddB [Cypionkella sp.]|nr:double-strand break repair protein AddB [Cypionkella sp.]